MIRKLLLALLFVAPVASVASAQTPIQNYAVVLPNFVPADLGLMKSSCMQQVPVGWRFDYVTGPVFYTDGYYRYQCFGHQESHPQTRCNAIEMDNDCGPFDARARCFPLGADRFARSGANRCQAEYKVKVALCESGYNPEDAIIRCDQPQ